VRDEDVSDLKLEFQPGVQVAGTVKVEGDAVLEPAPIIAFQVASGFASSRSMKIDANRAFELTNLAPDQYRLMVSQLPKGTYVKAIRAGGQVLPPGPIDLTGGDPGPIEILLSPNAADVRGAVRDDKGEPIPSASVALWSKGDNRPPVFGNTDENGAFQLGSIPPGEYFLAASENGELNNPNVRASLEGTATTVTLREGSHETADITLKP
jgi:hypothetical protein